jgi:ADP-ribose pyrophosphatase YjhB (NUDIX family)
MAKRVTRPFNPKKEVSVMAWIENDQGAVLFVRQALGRKLWTSPGGKVKRSESLKSALRREVREETGLAVTIVRYQQMYDRPKRGTITILSGSQFNETLLDRIFLLRRSPIADLGFFDRLPNPATPSARFFWNAEH